MKITITYQPQTITVTAAQAAEIRMLVASSSQELLRQRLLDAVIEHQGWVPEAAVANITVGK
jgi:hypothetical protein